MSAFIINVAFDAHDPRRLAAFWAEVTGYQPEFESDEVVRLHAPDARGVRRLVFWRVPEPKIAKSRVHVDLAARDRAAETERLLALGATKVEELPGWTVMLDPEGNEFCIGVGRRPRQRRSGATATSGAVGRGGPATRRRHRDAP